MKDKIYYYDRNGVLKLTLNEYPYYTEWADLRDWEWGYSEQFGRYTSFRRDKHERELIIVIAGDYLKAHDDLCDIFAADIIAGAPGQLRANDWTLNCYITEAEFEYGHGLSRKAVFKVMSEDPSWIRKSTRVLSGDSGGSSENDYGRDYTLENSILGRGYNYGYSLTDAHTAEIILPGSQNGYEIMFYGPITDPVIYLNGHPVQVNVTIVAGQRLRVVSNGSEKTIKILSSTGVETDAFIYRSKTDTPFIDIGQYTEVSYGDFRFDFTTIERRSEPTWT